MAKDIVLVIEDDPTLVNLYGDIIEYNGVVVSSASTGTDGVEMFKKNRDNILCVIVDFLMPGMSGLETIKQIRGICPDITIILISAFLTKNFVHGDDTAKPDFFLQKPFHLADLIDIIVEVKNTKGNTTCQE
jgi:CheY-like chemotaxis protein